jgi:hypothetical protein
MRGRFWSIILDVPTTVRRAAEITVGLPREQAMALFTPEGERRWAEGWQPRYPEPARREGPGAVFTTEHGAGQTTWIFVDQQPERIRYARVVDGMTAGTIGVDVVAASDDATQVRVTYDLTALTSEGEAWLGRFEANYDEAIASWSTEIAAALRRPA